VGVWEFGRNVRAAMDEAVEEEEGTSRGGGKGGGRGGKGGKGSWRKGGKGGKGGGRGGAGGGGGDLTDLLQSRLRSKYVDEHLYNIQCSEIFTLINDKLQH
jgi:hypothetical protein